MGITKDVVADYSFDKTGATSNSTKYFSNVRPDMVGQDTVVLNYQNGTYLFSGGFLGAYGIPQTGDVTINLNGSTLQDDGISVGPGSFLWASKHETQVGIDSASGQSARIQTVTAGATSVTLTTDSASAGHISRFAVGQWMMVTGWATQGDWPNGYSFPNNFHWHDYVKITSIVSNTIFFANHPLTYFYDANWPEINRGTAGEIDAAGPASIFAMALDWDGTTTVNSGTTNWLVSGGSTFVNSCRRDFVVNGVVQNGATFYPSMNKTYTAVNSGAPNTLVEHDKNIDTVSIQGGTFNKWKVQSSSTKLLQVSGATLTSATAAFEGTGRAAEIDSCTISNGSISLGPTSYGRGDTIRVTNTYIAKGVTGSGILIKGTRFQDEGVQDLLFLNSDTGVLTIPMCTAADILSYMMPDSSGRHVLFWTGNNGTFANFKSLSATSDRWPAVDNQTTSIGISTTNGSKTIVTDTPLIVSGDVGKCIFLPSFLAGSGSGYESCTISNESPGVVTKNNHARPLNQPLRFRAASGVLPAEITAGVTYYVVNPTTNTFQVSATVGGAAINTSGGSGIVEMTYSGDIYSFITGYVNSTTFTVYNASTTFDQTSVARSLQWGTCNAYIQTDMVGQSLPSTALRPGTGNKLQIRVPMRSQYFENCTGGTAYVDHQIQDLCQPDARNKSWGSYTKRSYDGSFPYFSASGDGVAPGRFGATLDTIGNLVSLKVNVLKEYTGASSLNLTFNLRYKTGDNQTGSYVFWAGTINLKQPGERVIQLNGVSSGSKSGDTLTAFPSNAWLCQGTQPQLSRSITSETAADWSDGLPPSFTVEVITDQGFPSQPGAVVPLRMRLRAD